MATVTFAQQSDWWTLIEVKRKLVLQDRLDYKIKEQGRVSLSLLKGQTSSERMHIE